MNSTPIESAWALSTYNICLLLFINKEGTYPPKFHYILTHSCIISMHVLIVSILYSHYITLYLYIISIHTSHPHTINGPPQVHHTTISHHNYTNSNHSPHYIPLITPVKHPHLPIPMHTLAYLGLISHKTCPCPRHISHIILTTPLLLWCAIHFLHNQELTSSTYSFIPYLSKYTTTSNIQLTHIIILIFLLTTMHVNTNPLQVPNNSSSITCTTIILKVTQ